MDDKETIKCLVTCLREVRYCLINVHRKLLFELHLMPSQHETEYAIRSIEECLFRLKISCGIPILDQNQTKDLDADHR